MLKVGDEVIFKTGKGPIMLVTKVNYPDATGRVLCKWWDKEARQYKTANFNEEELELHEEKEEE